MKHNQAMRLAKRFAELILAVDAAQAAWEEYAGPCHAGCPADCFNHQLSEIRRLSLGVIGLTSDCTEPK